MFLASELTDQDPIILLDTTATARAALEINLDRKEKEYRDEFDRRAPRERESWPGPPGVTRH